MGTILSGLVIYFMVAGVATCCVCYFISNSPIVDECDCDACRESRSDEAEENSGASSGAFRKKRVVWTPRWASAKGVRSGGFGHRISTFTSAPSNASKL